MTEDVMKTEGHTPTPWEYTGGDIWIDTRSLVCCGRGHNGECCGNPDVEGGQDLVAQTSEANAHLIVTAVNERSALLKCEEALREARQFIMNGVELGYIHIPRNDPAADTLSKISAALTLLDEARHGK